MTVLSSSMRALPVPALILCATLFLACGTEEPRVSTACTGVSCTAGYCVDDQGSASCRCSAYEQQLGLSCELDEVGDLDSQLEPTRLQVPTAPTSARLHRGDVDSYAFEVVAGHVYRFTCTPEGFAGCSLELYYATAYAWGPGPAELQTREGTTVTSTFLADRSGALQVDVSGWPAPDARVRGMYQLTLSEVADAEPDGDESASPVTTDGTPFTGHIDSRWDTDTFAFDAQAGHIYALHCTAESPGFGVVAPGEAGLSSTWSRTPGRYDAVVEAAVSGRHLVRVRSEAADGRDTYACAIEHRGAEDHGDTLALATAVATTPAQLVGTLEVKEDVDYFSFRALAGHAYELVCEPATQPACGSSSYIEIENRSLYGGVIAVAQDRTLGIRVSGGNQYATGPGRVGPYVLTLRDFGPDESAGPEDALPLEVDVTARGYCAPGDADYFKLQAQVGHIYRVGLPETASGYGTLSAFRLTALADDLLLNSAKTALFFKVEEAGPLVVRVGSAGGAYALLLEDLEMDDHPDVQGSATVLPGPALRVEGVRQTARDVDWIALELEARTYAVRQSFGWTRLDLLEADGVTLVPYDSWTQTYRPRAAGRHFLRARQSISRFDAQERYLFELDPR